MDSLLAASMHHLEGMHSEGLALMLVGVTKAAVTVPSQAWLDRWVLYKQSAIHARFCVLYGNLFAVCDCMHVVFLHRHPLDRDRMKFGCPRHASCRDYMQVGLPLCAAL